MAFQSFRKAGIDKEIVALAREGKIFSGGGLFMESNEESWFKVTCAHSTLSKILNLELCLEISTDIP